MRSSHANILLSYQLKGLSLLVYYSFFQEVKVSLSAVNSCDRLTTKASQLQRAKASAHLTICSEGGSVLSLIES